MNEFEDIKALEEEAKKLIESAKESSELDAIDTKFLGRKGELTLQLRKIGSLEPEKRKDFGAAVNAAKNMLASQLADFKQRFAEKEKELRLKKETLDVTVPGRFYVPGTPHVLMETFDDIKKIFIGLGYEIFDSPEVEEYKYNFAALNYPEEHPAIDEQMSFYIDKEHLLRTHTTAYQHRVMLNRKPPMKVCTTGKCYRVDAVDATHGHTFHQVDCFAIDKGITFSDLKGTLLHFAKSMLGQHVETRFRPDFFPFVEPGAEVAVTCTICGGKGCNVCKGSGWLELGGAGMIHPNILRGAGIDPEVYSGFAFGFGIERIHMLLHNVNDLRMFMDNDLRFLRQR